MPGGAAGGKRPGWQVVRDGNNSRMLHQPGISIMRVRGNTIYYESFAIALSADELQQIQGSAAWPADIDTDDIRDMLERIDWAGMRQEHRIDLAIADRLATRIKRGAAPAGIQVHGHDIACLCVVHANGYLGFSCPQASAARLGMNDTRLATEKADVIHMMIRSGRPGGPAGEDEFGGDNKAQRLHDHRFDWSFHPQGGITSWICKKVSELEA